MHATDPRLFAMSPLAEGLAAEAADDLFGATAAYEEAARDSSHRVAAEGLFRLGRLAWRRGRFDDALDYYVQARSRAQKADLHQLQARAENGIGAVHHSRGEYAQARASYWVALGLTDSDALHGKIVLNLGVIANIEGDLEAARHHYAESQTLFARAGDAEGEALALHSAGMLHADQGEWDAAEDAYGRCLRLFESTRDSQMIAHVLVNRAEVFCARQLFDDAIASTERARALCSELGDEAGRAEALRWEGHALARLGRIDAAAQALGECLRIATRLRLEPLRAEAESERQSLEPTS
jgi:tetratricopeptide (TPR) repeat protein